MCLRTLDGHSSDVYFVCVLSESRVVSGSYDKSWKVWDVDSGVCLRTLNGYSDYVHSVCVLSERRVVSGSTKNTLKV